MADDEWKEEDYQAVFGDMRSGLKTFVIDIAERVNIRLDSSTSEKGRPDPTWHEISVGIATHFARMATSLFSGERRERDHSTGSEKSKSTRQSDQSEE